MRTRTWTALAVAAVAGLCLAGASAGPPVVAFVNVNKVFNALPKKKKLEETLQSGADLIKARAEQDKAALRKDMTDVEAKFSPGTPEFEKARKALEMRNWEIDFDAKVGLDDLRRKQVVGMANLYTEIVAEAERLATSRGYQAVLNFDDEKIVPEENGQVIGPNDLKFRIALRTVVWVGPEADLTGDVITALAPK